MKRTKTLLLTLASCVLLSGCSILGVELPTFGIKLPEINVPDWLDPFDIFPNKDPKPDDEGEEEEKVVTISFDGMPEFIGIDEQVNLANIVKLENATSFSITLTDDSYNYALVSDKTITGFAEGTIEGQVKAGDKTKDFSIKVLSAERTMLIDVLETYKDDYSLVLIDEQGYATDVAIWGEKYYFSDQFDFDYDEEDNMYFIPGGYVEGKDGKVYSYYYGYPEEEDEAPTVQFLKTGMEPLQISGMFQSLDFIDGLTAPYDADEGAFILKAEDDPTLEAKASKLCNTPFENYVFTFDSLEIIPLSPEETGLENPTVLVAVLVNYQNELMAWSQFLIADPMENEAIKDFVDNEGQPVGLVDAKQVFGGAMDEALAAKNFTVEVDGCFYDDDYEVIENPYAGEEYENLIIHGLGVGQAFNFVTETETLQVNTAEIELTEGTIINDGKLYNYIYREVDDVGTFIAEEVGKARTVFDEIAGNVANFKFASSDAAFWDEIFVNNAGTNEDGTMLQVQFTGQTGKELLSAFGFVALNQSVDKEAITLTHGINTMLDEQYGFYEYFDVIGTLTLDGGEVDEVWFSFDFVIEEDVHYCIDIYIYDIGYTEIPNLGVDIVYPQI